MRGLSGVTSFCYTGTAGCRLSDRTRPHFTLTEPFHSLAASDVQESE